MIQRSDYAADFSVIYPSETWPFTLGEIVSGESPDTAALPEDLLLSSVGGRIRPFGQPPGSIGLPVYSGCIPHSAASSNGGSTEHPKCL